MAGVGYYRAKQGTASMDGQLEIDAEVLAGGLADIQAEFDRMMRAHKGKW
jgi:hypothetical protein